MTTGCVAVHAHLSRKRWRRRNSWTTSSISMPAAALSPGTWQVKPTTTRRYVSCSPWPSGESISGVPRTYPKKPSLRAKRGNLKKRLSCLREIASCLATSTSTFLKFDDEKLRRELMSEVFAEQIKNGSWNNSVVKTAYGILRALSVHVSSDDERIQKAAQWLLDWPEPVGRPGMWMLHFRTFPGLKTWAVR